MIFGTRVAKGFRLSIAEVSINIIALPTPFVIEGFSFLGSVVRWLSTYGLKPGEVDSFFTL